MSERDRHSKREKEREIFELLPSFISPIKNKNKNKKRAREKRRETSEGGNGRGVGGRRGAPERQPSLRAY